jgi:hypothetical protein
VAEIRSSESVSSAVQESDENGAGVDARARSTITTMVAN